MTMAEEPIEDVTGTVISGSITTDGNSACRRSCSLQILSRDFESIDNEFKINDRFKWYNSKFILKIGLLNTIDSRYPEICWFKQGVFVTNSFSLSKSINNCTVNISGSDKMCLLDGSRGGQFFANTRLNVLETQWYEEGVAYGEGLPIPINELIYQMLITYGGEQPHNIIISDIDRYGVYLVKNDSNTIYYKQYDANGTPINVSTSPQPGYDREIDKIEKDQVIGYRPILLQYTSDGANVKDALTTGIGENVVSILTKIRNFLGDFEFFYNVDGQFVFQAKKTYVNSPMSAINYQDNGNVRLINRSGLDEIAYSFTNNTLVTSFQNTPNLANIKNDYCVWGDKGTKDNHKYIHMRYAIDKKPMQYTSYEGVTYDSQGLDWREVLYQMAKDYFAHFHPEAEDYKHDFIKVVSEYNEGLYINGKTGYEQYYTDMLGFWREIYNPNPSADKVDLFYGTTDEHPYWAKIAFTNPELLIFWIDFLDTTGEISKFSVKQIGQKLLAEGADKNANTVDALFYPEVPYVVFIANEDQQKYKDYFLGYAKKYYQESEISDVSRGKSAKSVIDQWLYQYAYLPETVSITSVPIYHLQPNTKINITDVESGINGQYIINRFTLNLSHNGLMQLTANNIPSRLY